ncbi:MAG: leucine-rich repeat domain-containing protein, partial [Tannerellaceae bacterium]|nr:leucine-rich repeat domain-containing protein [Tannerellaceae bacterium]
MSGYAVPYESPTTTPTKTADGYYDITPSGGGIELRYEVIQESVDGNEGKLAVIAKNYAQDVPAYGIMGSLYIPAGFEWTENSEQKKYAVTKISSRAFWKCVITHVTFADDSKVDTIDSYAFYECMGLSKISLENTGEGVFPTSLKAIGAHAFVGTKLGGDINISGSIEHIGPAFQGTQISSLLIRKQEGGALEILADAFADCGSLTLVGIEAVGGTSVSIKSGAFVRSAPNGNGVSSSLTLFDVSVEEGAFTGSNFTQLVFEGHKDVAIAVKAGTFSGLSKVVSADFAGNILFK